MKINESASSDEATFATKPDARGDDPEAEEYRRGFGDGTVWATDYATGGQLGDPVEVPDRDNPYWQGFIEGVEEVRSTREPPAFGPENAI
jgi:hypothetical protein